MSIYVREIIESAIAVKQKLLDDAAFASSIENLSFKCLNSLRNGGKIIFCGNGGSFADAQHLSAEFTSRFLFDRAPLASIVLGANNSAISAIGNDYGYDQVFAREFSGVAKKDDLFIPITTSGVSQNIIAAVETARSLGNTTVALTGNGGGKLSKLCDMICVPSEETARIQECHIMIGHIVCEIVEKHYFSSVD